MIKNLKKHNDGMWTWRKDDEDGCYYTNENGEGIFFQDGRNGSSRQIIGNCQFSLSGYTLSGARKKINRFFE
jgi:hypothetical protein